MVLPPKKGNSSKPLGCEAGFVLLRAWVGEQGKLRLDGANPRVSIQRFLGLVEHGWVSSHEFCETGNLGRFSIVSALLLLELLLPLNQLTKQLRLRVQHFRQSRRRRRWWW